MKTKKKKLTKTPNRRGMTGLEIDTLKRLRKLKTIKSATYETSSFPYTIRKTYIADFTVVTQSGVTIYIETKGWFRPQDRTKMRAVREANPTADIRMVFPQNNKLNKTSKMRYSDWCEKHGIRYHIGSVPKEWFE